MTERQLSENELEYVMEAGLDILGLQREIYKIMQRPRYADFFLGNEHEIKALERSIFAIRKFVEDLASESGRSDLTSLLPVKMSQNPTLKWIVPEAGAQMTEQDKRLTVEQAGQVIDFLDATEIMRHQAYERQINEIQNSGESSEAKEQKRLQTADELSTDTRVLGAYREMANIMQGKKPPELTQLTTGVLRFNLSEAEETDNQGVLNY